MCINGLAHWGCWKYIIMSACQNGTSKGTILNGLLNKRALRATSTLQTESSGKFYFLIHREMWNCTHFHVKMKQYSHHYTIWMCALCACPPPPLSISLSMAFSWNFLWAIWICMWLNRHRAKHLYKVQHKAHRMAKRKKYICRHEVHLMKCVSLKTKRPYSF